MANILILIDVSFNTIHILVLYASLHYNPLEQAKYTHSQPTRLKTRQASKKKRNYDIKPTHHQSSSLFFFLKNNKNTYIRLLNYYS